MILDDPVCVLLIDDDEDTRIILRTLLEERGYRVLESADGPEGVEMAVHHRPEVVITEYLVPAYEGCCVPEELARAGLDVGVNIVWTAEATPDVSERIEALGAVFLPKPLQPEQVLDQMRARL